MSGRGCLTNRAAAPDTEQKRMLFCRHDFDLDQTSGERAFPFDDIDENDNY